MVQPPPSVLVIGAGPVGLAAALELSRRGARVRIIDQAEAPTAESRAIGINPRTLHLLQASDVTARLIQAGVRVRGFRLFANERLMATFDLTRLPGPYPFMLALPQSETERILADALAAQGVRVERGTRFVHLTARPDGLEASLAGRTSETASADWLVGADGAHSAVRKAIGSSFPGAPYPFRWSLADLALVGNVEPDLAEIHLDPGRPVLFRLPIGSGLHRVIANDVDVLARLPPTWSVERVVWTSQFRVSHRLADRIRKGRAILIGDAAHIHSPAGGRGMNLGIEDAATLAPRILAGSLGDWAAHRQRRARQVVRESDRLQSLATASGFLGRRLVPVLGALAARLPLLHDALIRRLADLPPDERFAK